MSNENCPPKDQDYKKKETGGPSHKREEPPAHIKRHLISLTCGLPIRNVT